MKPRPRYLEEPLKLVFEAEVVEVIPLAGGRTGIILDHTYFYPTGGGQEHDTGWLDEVQVIEVYTEGDPARIVHVTIQPVPIGLVQARVDRERRLQLMQLHTAQHLLSQCFLQLFEIQSISANINASTPSTLDVATNHVSQSNLIRVENLANQIIYENRPVKSYFVRPDELERYPLRWPPAVNEDIRIVEIEAFDYTPCGGTHCSHTGTIGLLKILKAERQGEQSRLTFTTGQQALRIFQTEHELISSLAGRMSVQIQDLPAAVQRQADQLKAAQQTLDSLRQTLLENEAQKLAQGGQPIGPYRLVLAVFEGRPAAELRRLSTLLKEEPGVVSALASSNGETAELLVSCAQDTGLSARDVLTAALTRFSGRGGGNPGIAQGGAPGTVEIAKLMLEAVREGLSSSES